MSSHYWVSPTEANLLVTGRCNLRCRHCSVTSCGDLAADLSLQKWIGILDELRKSKLIKLTITGGEPLQRPDFADFLAAIYERPFRYSINTNGTLITPSVIDSVRKYSSRLDTFMVSLDGPDPETVNAQRGEGVFKKLISGVNALKTAEFPFGFYCTVTSLNVDKLSETAELAMSLGAGWIKFNNFLMAGPGLNSSMIPDPVNVSRAVQKLRVLEDRYPGRITGTILDMLEIVNRHKKGFLPKTGDRAYSCGGGKAKIAVFPDGRVTPCDHLPNLTLGNITEQSLEDILTGNKMREFSEFMAQPRSTDPDCNICKYIDYCNGGCPVEALSKNDRIGIDRHSCLRIAMGE